MRSWRQYRSWFSSRSKLQQSVHKATPLFIAESLEARRLLTGTLNASANAAETLADLPAAAQQATSSAIVQQAKLTAEDGAANDGFGSSFAISGNTMVVGAPGDGVAYVFTESGFGWTQTAELSASDGAAGASFGYSVSISGNTVVAGSDGAAYVFIEPGTGWTNMTPTAKLTASDGASGDQFGNSVAISGNTIVAGAPNASVGGNSQQGATYVFTEPASGWGNMPQTAKLTASDGAASDHFGWSVAISGNAVVVGATWAKDNGNWPGKGAAYMFTEPGSGWAGNMTQTAKFTPSDGELGGAFGISVAISGNTVVVGAAAATVGGNYSQSAAYVFTEPGTAWSNMTQPAEFTAYGTAYDDFGDSLAINGSTVVIGAEKATVDGNSDQGAAYVFGPSTSTAITVTPPGNQTTAVGQGRALALGSFAAGSNTNAPFTVDVSWGDGSPDSIIPVAIAGAIPATRHTYAYSDNDTVTESVTDSGNHTSNIATFTVAVPSCTLTTLVSFNGTNGAELYSGLVADHAGDLYGTTGFGGAGGNGTVFEIGAGNNALATLATFNGTNASSPNDLATDLHGNLYGTTDLGGNLTLDSGKGDGTVFEIAAGNQTFSTLATFNGTNGAAPEGGPLVDAAGNLYGTTMQGGNLTLNGRLGDGTLFEIAAGTSTISTLASFNGTDGEIPKGDLIADSQGNLYGTTWSGGVNGDGTVFKFDPATDALTTLVSFNGTNGENPHGILLVDAAGNLYGTTDWGGAYGNGTAFKIAAGTSTITTLVSFGGAEGSQPSGGLIADAAGNLYGTTMGVADYGNGTVFKIAADSDTLTTLATFNGTNGDAPYAGLIADAAGNLYGTTYSGGAYGNGTAFKLSNTGFISIAVTPATTQTATPGQGQLFTLGSFTESNATGPFSVDVNWGDATADSIFSVAAAGNITAQSHTYAASGNYTVSETVTDSGNYTSNTSTFTITAAAVPNVSIAGTVYADANGNLTGLSDVMVYLDSNDNGKVDAGEISVNTNASGNYVFSSLPAGNYTVREVVPGGYAQTSPAAGYIDLTLTTGQTVTGQTFLDAPTGNATQVAVYRLYSPVTLEHLYTTDPNEYNTLESYVGTWNAEGQVFSEYSGPATVGGVADEPYYRLYNPSVLQHLWTTDLNEYTVLATEGWNQEGIVGYVFPTAVPAMASCTPLYRLRAPNVHVWTTTLNEYDTLQTEGWTGEGIIGYVL